MNFTTDHYAYEYSIIQKLYDIFNIKNTELNKETYDISGYDRDEYGNLQKVVLSKIEVDNYIQLNFKHDFHYCISRKSLFKAFEENCSADEVVTRLKSLIESVWKLLMSMKIKTK